MNAEQAAGFVSRYRNLWRGGPPSDELTTHVAKMDAGTLDRVYAKLLETGQEHAPSIAQLWREHRALQPTDYGWTPPVYTGPIVTPYTGIDTEDPHIPAWLRDRVPLEHR